MPASYSHIVLFLQVAIKIIDTRKIKDEYVRGNLHREARLMTSLRHPNIIRLYETLKVGSHNPFGTKRNSYIKYRTQCTILM